MKGILNKYDYEPLPSNPTQKRWENSVQWARNTMVNEGLLSSDSPRGIWEITQKGRDFYNQQKTKSKIY
jgi:restriction endonuclease Mrr